MAGSKRKKHLGLLLLLLAMIVLLGVYFWLVKYNDKKDTQDTATEETKAIVSLDTSTIESIYFKNPSLEMTLTLNSEGVWEESQDSAFPVNQTYAANMQNAFADITPTSTLTEGIDDLSAFGLDNPEITATASTSDGKETTVMIGNETPFGGEYYAALAGSNEVYVIGTSFYSYFHYTRTDLTAVETIPAVTAENVTKLSVTAKEGKDFEVVYDEDSPYDYSGFSNYIIHKPYAIPVAADNDSMTTLFGNYASLSFSSCADYNATDLSKYGLEEPAYTVSLDYYEEQTAEADSTNSSTDTETDTDTTDADTTDSTDTANTVKVNKSLTLLIGATNEDGNYYAKTSDSNAVNILDSATVEKLTAIDAYSNTYKYVNLISIEAVDSIDITAGGASHTLTIERETTTEDGKDTTTAVYNVDKKTVEEEVFKKFYQVLIAPKTEREIPEADLTKGEKETPVMTITYHLNTSDTPFVVEFKPYDDSYYIVNTNGTEYFLMDLRNAASITDGLKELLQ